MEYDFPVFSDNLMFWAIFSHFFSHKKWLKKGCENEDENVTGIYLNFGLWVANKPVPILEGEGQLVCNTKVARSGKRTYLNKLMNAGSLG